MAVSPGGLSLWPDGSAPARVWTTIADADQAGHVQLARADRRPRRRRGQGHLPAVGEDGRSGARRSASPGRPGPRWRRRRWPGSGPSTSSATSTRGVVDDRPGPQRCRPAGTPAAGARCRRSRVACLVMNHPSPVARPRRIPTAPGRLPDGPRWRPGRGRVGHRGDAVGGVVVARPTEVGEPAGDRQTPSSRPVAMPRASVASSTAEGKHE